MRFFLTAASLVAATLISAQAGAALVTTPTGTLYAMPVANYFGPGPVTFGPSITWSSTNASNQSGAVFGFDQGYGFGPNGYLSGFPLAGVNSSFDAYGVSDSMTFSFTTGVSSVGGTINWFGDTPATTIAIYDTNNVLLESFDVDLNNTNLATPNSFLGFSRPTAEIGSFVLTGGYIALYDLRVTGLPVVPEPASWAMMLAGFGLAGTALRRRRGRLAAC